MSACACVLLWVEALPDWPAVDFQLMKLLYDSCVHSQKLCDGNSMIQLQLDSSPIELTSGLAATAKLFFLPGSLVVAFV